MVMSSSPVIADVTNLQDLAGQLLTQGRRSERVIYWRKPNKGLEASWITTGGTNMERQLQFLQRGFVPLTQYGEVGFKRRADDPDGPFERYGQWGPILTHPQGPREFPVDQIVAYRWYDPAFCPVPGVRFPQMVGVKIVEFDCPECNNARFHKATHLARHLRVTHGYDRAELVALGQELGLSFAKEIARGGTVERIYTIDETDLPPVDAVEQGGLPDIEKITLAPRRRGEE